MIAIISVSPTTSQPAQPWKRQAELDPQKNLKDISEIYIQISERKCQDICLGYSGHRKTKDKKVLTVFNDTLLIPRTMKDSPCLDIVC